MVSDGDSGFVAVDLVRLTLFVGTMRWPLLYTFKINITHKKIMYVSITLVVLEYLATFVYVSITLNSVGLL